MSTPPLDRRVVREQPLFEGLEDADAFRAFWKEMTAGLARGGTLLTLTDEWLGGVRNHLEHYSSAGDEPADRNNDPAVDHNILVYHHDHAAGRGNRTRTRGSGPRVRTARSGLSRSWR